MISEGYLIELEDNSFTGESHVLVSSRYYEKYKHMPEFTTAKSISKCLDLQEEISKYPYLNVWE
jgi:hypothetical protein